MPTIERLMLDGQPEPVSHYCHVTRAGNLVLGLRDRRHRR